ncbi:MAG: anthranilate phosphoribosyltransferase [Aquificaceae bacterium]
MQSLLKKLSLGENLSREECIFAFEAILSGEASPSQIGAFLMGLCVKGETKEELVAGVEVLRSKALKISLENPEELVDNCGTGGDMAGTFNISTASAFVLAGGGVRIAKHGNRSVSSKSGSADFLKALGAKVELGPEEVSKMISELGIGFLYAPIFHPAMKLVAPIRKELGFRSIFNLIGPLSNPAFVKRQVVGVYSGKLLPLFAQTLLSLGSLKAFVVFGKEGLDEVSVCGETDFASISANGVSFGVFHPSEVGLKTHSIKDLQVNSPEESVKVVLSALSGESSPVLDAIILNAAFGFVVADLASDLKSGVEMAKESVFSGKALKKLKDFVELSNRL